MEETSITFHGNAGETQLAWALDRALRDALMLKSKLPDWVLAMPGMSGRKYRRLINNLVGLAPRARYLEVGSWAGSTACSAMFANSCACTCIDNWSQFGGPKDAFETHTNAARSDAVAFTAIEQDFRQQDFAAIGKYNIYLFDGPHEFQDQLDGVTMAQPALDDEYVQIVDDWNWPQVREGTVAALTSLRLRIVYGIEVRTTQDGSHPQIAGAESDWHNGYFIAVLARN